MPRLTFSVRIPEDPQRPDRLRAVVVGSDRILGDWQPEKGLQLEPDANGIFRGEADVPYGLLEFKLTRGSWATEEADRSGGAAVNYRYLVAHDMHLELAVQHWKDLPPWEPELLYGKTIECELDATQLGENRRVCIWLPPGYMQSADSRHPVLYLFDGQNALGSLEEPGSNSLRVDDWVRRLAEAGRIPELILVAILHRDQLGQRDVELSPQCDGPKLAHFLANDLKPFVDFIFCRDRVLPEPENTGVLGFSLAASLALFMAIRHGNHFGRFACMSPTYWDLSADSVDECWLFNQVKETAGFARGTRLYFDHGTLGADAGIGPYQERMNALLESKGLKAGKDFRVNACQVGQPGLNGWQARLGAALEFLWGKPKETGNRKPGTGEAAVRSRDVREMAGSLVSPVFSDQARGGSGAPGAP